MIKTSLLVLRDGEEETTFATPCCYHRPLSLSLDGYLFPIPEKGFTSHLDSPGEPLASQRPQSPPQLLVHCSYTCMCYRPTCPPVSMGTTHAQVTLSRLRGKVIAHPLFEPYAIVYAPGRERPMANLVVLAESL